MKTKMIYLLTVLLQLLILNGYSQCYDCCQDCLQDEPNRLFVAPVWQYTQSNWSNHTQQDGNMWAVAAGYDHTKISDFYWGAEFDYSRGKLTGSAGNNQTWQYIGEGRFGYTLSFCALPRLLVTPYLGFGYYSFEQKVSPGKFKTGLWYVPFGVRLGYSLSDCFKIGLNGSVGPAFNGEWKLTADSDHWRHAPTKVIWRVECPLTYNWKLYDEGSYFDLSLVPFVRNWAVYSKGELDGQRNLYTGIRLELGCNF